MSIRLPEDLASDLETVARTDGLPMNAIVGLAVDAHVRSRRSDPEFQDRLRRRIAKDKQLLGGRGEQ